MTQLDTVFGLFNLGDEKSMQSALNVCSVLFMYISDNITNYLDRASEVIKRAMEVGSLKLRVVAIQALGSLITTLSPKEVKRFFFFSSPVLTLLTDMFFGPSAHIDHACDVLSVVSEIVETDPKFFRENFADLISLMFRVRGSKDLESLVKDQALEVAVSMSQRYPEFLQEKKALLSQIVEMVFLHMIEIPDECPEEWSNPPDGFDEVKMEDESQRAIKFATDCIDRLCSSVGSKIMLQYLSDCVAQLLATNDWKKVFAAFMALSQVGEYMEDVDAIKPIVIKLSEYAFHPEPRVRYAVLHCLGQISDDFAPKFQEFYHQEILPLLLKSMADKVPRVVAHTCACATNFIENCDEKHLAPIFDQLYSTITSIIDQASSFVKENALNALSALCVGAPDLFLPHYNMTMEVLLKILEQVNNPNFKKLRGNSIECISIISHQIGYSTFAPYADRLVAAMIYIQENHLSKEEDPQRNFILQAWPRISEVMKGKFDSYIPRIVPSIVVVCNDVASSMPEQKPQDPLVDKQDEKKEVFHTFIDDECNNALATISAFLQDCPAAMSPFIEAVYNVVNKLMAYETNEEIRTTAAECLAPMVESIKLSPEMASKLPILAKAFIARLWEIMDGENEPEILIKQATAMQKLIENSGEIFSAEELDSLFNKCIDHLQRSDERKKNTDKQIDTEEDELEVLEVYEQDKDLENQLHCSIAEIFGKLFETHKAKALPIFERLHLMFIHNSLQDSQTDMIKKFGLFLICDSVDHLGLLIGDSRLAEYFQYLKKYCVYPQVFVRHAAVYGLGSMALVLKDKWMACLEDSLSTLKNSFQLPRGAEDEEIYNATRENTVSSIGKIIKATWDSQTQDFQKLLVNEWLAFLPLKVDKGEAVISHRFLVELLEKHRAVVLNKLENLQKVMNIIGTVWKTKSSDAELDLRMSRLLKQWASEPELGQAMASVELSQKKKEFIQKALQEASN